MQEYLQPTQTTDLIREILIIAIGLISRYVTLKKLKKNHKTHDIE